MNLEYPSRGQLQEALSTIFKKNGVSVHSNDGGAKNIGLLSLRQIQQQVEALFVVKLTPNMLEIIGDAIQSQVEEIMLKMCLDVGLSTEDAELVIETERLCATDESRKNTGALQSAMNYRELEHLPLVAVASARIGNHLMNSAPVFLRRSINGQQQINVRHVCAGRPV